MSMWPWTWNWRGIFSGATKSFGTSDLYSWMNGLYAPQKWLTSLLNSLSSDRKEQRELRNPVHRVIDFWKAHLWHGDVSEAFKIRMRPKSDKDPDLLKEDKNPKLKNIMFRIDDILAWSNAAQKKEDWVGEMALKGAWVCKVVHHDEKVYLQSVHNEYLTDIEVDDQLHVQYIRVDIPYTVRQDDETTKPMWHTEIWDKSKGNVRIWLHEKGQESPIASLGKPDETQTIEEYGSGDFIPWVYAPFSDIGEKRGMDATSFCWPKIATANENAKHLHSMVFRNGGPLWVGLSDSKDAQGRLLPPPKLNADGTSTANIVDLSGEKFLSSNFREVKCLVPSVNFDEILKVNEAHEVEIEKDLPELLWTELVRAAKNGQIAAETVRLLLAPAGAKVLQRTANANAGMVRALQISLTVGQNLGMQGFSIEDIGTYQDGDFDFEIVKRPFFPLTKMEQAQADLVEQQADKAAVENGIPYDMILRRKGTFSDEEIKEIMENKEKRDAEKAQNDQKAEDRKKITVHTGLAESNVNAGASVNVGKDDGK